MAGLIEKPGTNHSIARTFIKPARHTVNDKSEKAVKQLAKLFYFLSNNTIGSGWESP